MTSPHNTFRSAHHRLTGVAKTLNMSRLVVVIAMLKAFVLSLKKGGEVHQRHSQVPSRIRLRLVTYIIRVESSENCSQQSALTQNLTLPNFRPLNCCILCMKSYIRNSQKTYVDIHGPIETGPENSFHLVAKCIMRNRSYRKQKHAIYELLSCQCFVEDIWRGFK